MALLLTFAPPKSLLHPTVNNAQPTTKSITEYFIPRLRCLFKSKAHAKVLPSKCWKQLSSHCDSMSSALTVTIRQTENFPNRDICFCFGACMKTESQIH